MLRNAPRFGNQRKLVRYSSRSVFVMSTIHFSITTMDSTTDPGLHQMLSALRGGADSDFHQILSRTVNQGTPGAAPATQQTMDALERVHLDSASPPQCPVCFDDITGQAVCALLRPKPRAMLLALSRPHCLAGERNVHTSSTRSVYSHGSASMARARSADMTSSRSNRSRCHPLSKQRWSGWRRAACQRGQPRARVMRISLAAACGWLPRSAEST